MSHDKIRAAARKRMAETGGPYAAARREVIREHQAAGGQIPRSDTQWFAISYSRAGIDKITAWMDTLFGAVRVYRVWRSAPTRSGSGWAPTSSTYRGGLPGPRAGLRKSSAERLACTCTRRGSCW